MENYHIVVIGDGEAALACVMAARNTYMDKSIAIIKTDKRSTALEEILSTVSNGFDKRLNIFYDDILGRSHNVLHLSNGNDIEYERLVISTGSCSIEPPIDGLNKTGVAFISQNAEQNKKTGLSLQSAENIVIYGGGYVGVELCVELLKYGKKITLIENEKRLMPSSFDLNLSSKVKTEIEKLGGKVLLGKTITSVIGKQQVAGVKFSTDEIIDCDFLLLSCGTKPNVKVAEKLGIVFDRDRGILIDGYFKTSDKDISAVGECAAKFDFFSSDFSSMLMQNSPIEEAKVLGSNLYSLIFNRRKMINYIPKTNKTNVTINSELQKTIRIKDKKEMIPV